MCAANSNLDHNEFAKIYRLDLVVDGIIYEFKTVRALLPEHEAQGIHYAAMTDTDRVKLVNFRTAKVVGQLLRRPFSMRDRRRFSVDPDRWEPLSEHCPNLIERMQELLQDWGAFLEAGCYEEALNYSFGNSSKTRRRVQVTRDGLHLGSHGLSCHAKEVGFLITAFTQDTRAYESHIRRLLGRTHMQGLQWMNLAHSRLVAVTLHNEDHAEKEAEHR